MDSKKAERSSRGYVRNISKEIRDDRRTCSLTLATTCLCWSRAMAAGGLLCLMACLSPVAWAADADGFDFNDGTMQGWTTDGAYISHLEIPLASNFSVGWSDVTDYPGDPESSGAGDSCGSLELYTPGGHGIEGPNSVDVYWRIELVSPDLSSSQTWQQAAGFTVQIANCTVDPNVVIYANHHVFFSDPNSEGLRHFANIATALLHGQWQERTYNWHEGTDPLPPNAIIHRIEVYIWGSMATGGELAGSVYIDEVQPIRIPATYYVDVNGGGPGEDGSLDFPFDSIQEAVNTALAGDTVVIKDGVYTGDGNWGIDLQGKSISVRSLNGPANCIVRNQADQGSDLPGFHFRSGETEMAMLKGLTITGSTGGAGIVCVGSGPTILNCILRDNHASEGGGIYCEDSSPSIRNCAFLGNTADRGAAIYATRSRLTITNCTVTGNEAVGMGGGIHLIESVAEVANGILWRNTAPLGPQLSLTAASTATISYCALGEGTADDCFGEADSVLDRSRGNIAVDPLMADDGYHLQPDSPCVDAGQPWGAYWELVDIDDVSRLFNERVDIGADEFSPKIRNLTQGTSANAIQEAVDQAVDGDTIEVPSGIYTGKGNLNIDFWGKAITLRSAEDPARCIIDCHGRREEVLRTGFKFVHGEGRDSVLDGFTIRNGYSIAGGAAFISRSSPAIRNCRLVYNWANDGGGAISSSEGHPTFTNCLFLNNGGYNGGGLSIYSGNATIDNCTFIHNLAHDGGLGGALRCSSGHTEINNCVFWNNVVLGLAGSQISLKNLRNEPTSMSITNSLVMGGREDVLVDSLCRLDWGVGNTDVDPLLTPDGHLRSGSPCIDAGMDLGKMATDCEGEPRVIGDAMDLGCDEYLDSDGDQLPDYWELQFFDSATAASATEDVDGDTFSNLEECTQFGSNPISAPYFVDGAKGSDVYDGLAPEYVTESHGPKRTIQAGIDAASNGATVLVAAGTYSTPYGAGLQTWGKPIVVHAPEGPESTTIDCNGLGRGFSFWYHETPDTTVSGFTVARGQLPYPYGGGAILCYNGASPRIRNCVLTDSEASAGGGGLYSALSTPIIENCRIEGNRPNDLLVNFGCLHLYGINRLVTNAGGFADAVLAGSGVLELQSSANLTCIAGYELRIRCDISGPGILNIPLGSSLVIDGDAAVDLGDADGNGRILCDGMLRVRDRAQITNAEITVSRASFEGDVDISNNNIITAEVGAPYGQFFVEDSVTIADNEIHADGDRYMDLDPSVFAGVIANNRIYVTITEGQHSTRGGLLELRGNDTVCSAGSLCEPGAFKLPSVPGFDTTTWTIERLELLPGAQVSLTNRFDFGNGGFNEVMYTKELVLGNGCILNTAYNRLYYEQLEDHGGALVNLPLLGFSLNVVRFDDENEFVSRIIHNNFVHNQTPAYSRTHIARVLETPDPAGMMRMHNLKDQDPASLTYGQVIHARAKALFAKSREDQILIMFDYLFETDDPNTELAIYLSDVPDLHTPRDPDHSLEVGRLHPPLRGRPGSVGSERFGTFHQYVPRGRLDFIRGTRVEFELIGPENASLLINDWDPRIVCPNDICLNFVQNGMVESLDLLPVIAACGRAAGLEQDENASECLDGALSCDGYVDTRDTVSFEWAQRSWMASPRSNLCPTQSNGDHGLPLVGNRPVAATSATSSSPVPTGYSLAAGASLDDEIALFILGKPLWRSKEAGFISIVSERLYGLDGGGHHVETKALAHGWCNAKLACDRAGSLYQITVDGGVLRLHDDGSSSPVIAPCRMQYGEAEPRYGRNADVYIGIQDDGSQLYGRPIWDIAFDAESVYVVPVVVAPDSDMCPPYLAAAKLKITAGGGPGFRIEELYDDPDALGSISDNPHLGGLREIEVDDENNVYVVNACSRNESDMLWKYKRDGSIQRLCLTDPNAPVSIPDPTGLCVSGSTGTVYMVSGQMDQFHPQATTVYGFSTEDLTLKRRITIENMQLATDIAEDPMTGTLWVVGFNLEESELDVTDWDDVRESFYQPCLAKVSPNNAVELVAIGGDHDLALPLSVLFRPNSSAATSAYP